jgi:uncharacterized protein YkvS
MKNIYVLFFIIILLLSCINSQKIFADDENTESSRYSQVFARFFYNTRDNREIFLENENKWIYYYDENMNLTKTISLDEKGRARTSATYKYENNELVEYINYTHGLIEKSEENGYIVIITKEMGYNDKYEIKEKKLLNRNGNLLSTEEMNPEGGYYQYYEYNEYGDVKYEIYENEKSHGRHYITYKLEYDKDEKLIHRKAYENDILIYERSYQYNENDLLTLEITNSYRNNNVFIVKEEYQYNNAWNITSEKRFENDKEISSKYYEYDIYNRLIKKGQKGPLGEQYWIYEYS